MHNVAERNKEIVSRLRALLDKYENEMGFDTYSEDTVVQDLIFFTGKSIDPDKYNYAQGFRALLKRLFAMPGNNVAETAD